MLVVATVLSIGMGILLGLLGGGGSILTVPILRYVLEVAPKVTIATSLLVVGATAAVGLVLHARKGHVVWRMGLIFAAFAMGGAFAGGQLARFIPGSVLLLLFAVLALVTGAAMLRERQLAPVADGEAQPPRRDRVWWAIGLEGLVVGVITGMVGAGGGFLVVPALVLLGGLGMVEAIGTSLLVIALKSLAGFAGYAQHVEIDWALAGIVTLAAALGTLGGTWLATRIRPARLRRGFALFVFAMALFVLYKEGAAYASEVLAAGAA